MNAEDFNKVVEGRVKKMNAVLVRKAKEYSSDNDRLYNFKVAAQMGSTKETPEKALFGMMKKHLVSLIDIVEKTASGEFPDDAMRDEKLGGIVNYTVLLEALLIERKNTTEPEKRTANGTNATLVFKPGAPGQKV